MTFLGDLCFSDFFVDVVHHKVNNFGCEDLYRQLVVVVVVCVSVDIEVGLEHMLCLSLKLFELTGQMITVCFYDEKYILMISNDIR